MLKQFHEKVSNNIGRGNVVMKKLLGIMVLSLLICSSNFADVKSSELVNTIMKKNENFNLGIKEEDTTINGLKLRVMMKKEAYSKAVKNN